jgi:hypothetical protein
MHIKHAVLYRYHNICPTVKRIQVPNAPTKYRNISSPQNGTKYDLQQGADYEDQKRSKAAALTNLGQTRKFMN